MTGTKLKKQLLSTMLSHTIYTIFIDLRCKYIGQSVSDSYWSIVAVGRYLSQLYLQIYFCFLKMAK